MRTLSPTRFGFALAAAWALCYVGCAFVMATVPKDVAIQFFNSLMHGIDVTPIMRWEMPWWEMVVGVLEVFILGWLFGAVIAVFYNFRTPDLLENRVIPNPWLPWVCGT